MSFVNQFQSRRQAKAYWAIRPPALAKLIVVSAAERVLKALYASCIQEQQSRGRHPTQLNRKHWNNRVVVFTQSTLHSVWADHSAGVSRTILTVVIIPVVVTGRVQNKRGTRDGPTSRGQF